MTVEQATDIVMRLNAAFPRDALEPETVRFWIEEVSTFDRYDGALAAARTIGRGETRFPHLSEFRQEYREAVDRLNAGKVLAAIEEPGAPPPEEVRRWVADHRIGRPMPE